jgi:hypothetical protein
MKHLPFHYHDGGRAAAGFRGGARDCATRAITIATGADYLAVYEALARAAGHYPLRPGRATRYHPRTGLPKPVVKHFMLQLGWRWTPTMRIGSGCKVHLRADELPGGRLVVAVSKHVCAVVDGVLLDTHDCSRGGQRCVYGYWQAPLAVTVAG